VTPAEAVALAVGAVAAAAAVRAMPAPPAIRRRERTARRGPALPAELTADQRLVRMAMANAAEAHHRLVPALREVARQRLAAYRRIDLTGDPAAARRALGAETWELVRPDRPAPADRHARGLRPEQLEAAIADLERLRDR
jgi:hypothetical protein